MFLQERRCPYCRGKGYEKQLPREPRPHRCPDCEGEGYQRQCIDCEEWLAITSFSQHDEICNECYNEKEIEI